MSEIEILGLDIYIRSFRYIYMLYVYKFWKNIPESFDECYFDCNYFLGIDLSLYRHFWEFIFPLVFQYKEVLLGFIFLKKILTAGR